MGLNASLSTHRLQKFNFVKCVNDSLCKTLGTVGNYLRFNQNVIANFTRVCLLVTKVLTLPFPAVNTVGNMYNEMKYILREFLLDICEVTILNENKEICCSTGVWLDLYIY